MVHDIRLEDKQVLLTGSLFNVVADTTLVLGEFIVGNPFAVDFTGIKQPTSTFRGKIHASGEVGIGTSEPGYKLDVADRMRVRQAKNTAGIWFYQTKPAKDQAFVGMSSDTQVGFWGNTGAGWGLVMDTTTGKIDVTTLQAKHTIRVAEQSADPDVLLFAGQAFTSVDSDSITINGTTINKVISSLNLSSETILFKKTLKLGMEKSSWKDMEVLDLVKEIKSLRAQVDSLNAKVKALEATQKK
ncbi:MAG TPA: hypothetical protein DCY88_05005 [Cyanobacteria bacterium UBA11372]|nr:hypothetical protein [Cyanobacteria bacterium UBA11372]HBE34781.1 hypothetical protein [Cyanobacteria bacterium UBA11368]